MHAFHKLFTIKYLIPYCLLKIYVTRTSICVCRCLDKDLCDAVSSCCSASYGSTRWDYIQKELPIILVSKYLKEACRKLPQVDPIP